MEATAAATILGDRELMEYAVYNLLTNAVKYSPAETRIEVTFEQRGSELLRLRCAIRGSAWTPTKSKKIFNKFYRTKRAEASGEAGTGIGLSIVEQIVAITAGEWKSKVNRKRLMLYYGIEGTRRSFPPCRDC
jgi:signal transduction histidine kinase